MTDDRFQCRCVLCHDYGDRDEADRVDLAIIENVQQHGWHVVMVPEDEIGPGFAYTIGLAHTHGAPELAMFGLDIHVRFPSYCGDRDRRDSWGHGIQEAPLRRRVPRGGGTDRDGDR
ncbi:DUF4262 domain-containing protein [Streptomyces sp. NPDC006739]|uniref:DUF4262 domain-containing protein n=1 Tax=Streptomyces sp. NPDC006739 TaxID=3364763 RepID=UPI0036B55380